MQEPKRWYVRERLGHLLNPRQRAWHYSGAVVGLLVALVVYSMAGGLEDANLWADLFDPWITMATLVVACLLAVGTWMRELPKKLTIHFMRGDHYVMTCWEASLGGEGDIRQWAQQIGRQMCGQLLDFDPYPLIRGPRVKGGTLGLRLVYEITITLTKDVPVAGYLVWGPEPSLQRSSASRPTRPLSIEELDKHVGEPDSQTSAIHASIAMGSTLSLTRVGAVLTVGLPDGVLGDDLVKQALDAVKSLESRGDLSSGGLLGVNGRCTLPIGVLLGHALAHLFSAVAMWDPKLNEYIVCISHDPTYPVGKRIGPDVLALASPITPDAPDPASTGSGA